MAPLNMGPDSRLLKPILDLLWQYQRDDADTIVHYKFNEAALPIADHSLRGSPLTANMSARDVTFLNPGPPGLDASVGFHPDGTAIGAPSYEDTMMLYGVTTTDLTVSSSENVVTSAVVKVVPPSPPVYSTVPVFSIAIGNYTGWTPGFSNYWTYNQFIYWPPYYSWFWNGLTAVAVDDPTFIVRWDSPQQFLNDSRPRIPVNEWVQLVTLWDRTLHAPRVIVNGVEITDGVLSLDPPNFTTLGDISPLKADGSRAFVLGATEQAGLTSVHLGYTLYLAEYWASKGLTYHQNPCPQ